MTESHPQPLEAIVAAHAPFVERLARALVGDRQRAEDLAQDTWAAALRDPAELRELAASGGGRLRGWLAVVLRRRTMSVARQERLRPTSQESETLASERLTPEETAARLERQSLVQGALSALTEPYRTTLVMRFQDGLSAAEIARAAGVPASTVRSQVTRGLAQIRETLDRQHGGGRAEWLAALLPLAYPPRLTGAALAASSGTGPTFTAAWTALAMNKIITGAALALLAVYFVGGNWGMPFGFSGPREQGTATLAVPANMALVNGDGEEFGDGETGLAQPRRESAPRSIARPEEGASNSSNFADAGLEEELTPTTAVAAGPKITGRATLLDGTPIQGHRIDGTVGDTEGHRQGVSAVTDEEGRFELIGLDDGLYEVTLRHHGAIDGVTESNVPSSTEGLELRVDGLIFRPTIPKGFDLARFKGSGYSVMAFGLDEIRFPTFHYGGFQPASDLDVRQELLPTGPGYMAIVGTIDEGPMAAAIEPGAPSGSYEVEFASESPALCAVQVVLSGAEIAAPSHVTVSFERVVGGDTERVPGSLFLHEGERRGRTGVLLPGEYRVDTGIFGPPPIAWVRPRALQDTFELTAGEETLIEVSLIEGGGVALQFDAAGAVDPRGLTLERWDEESSSWSRHQTYLPTEDGGFKMGGVDQAGVLYRSWTPLSVGEARFRLSGHGLRTEEATLYIRTGVFTEWKPMMEALP